MKISIFSLVLLCLVGCYSVEKTPSSETGATHIIVMNYGWHLFDTYPLMCGNTTAEEDGRCGPWAFFRDDVTIENTQRLFMKEAAKVGGELGDLDYWVRENYLYEVPGLQIPLPIPYVLTYREIQLSGVVK